MKNKYTLYFGNEEVRLTKNQYKELLKWRETQISQDMQKKLDRINKQPTKKGTLDS